MKKMRKKNYEIVVECPDCKIALPTEHVYIYKDKDNNICVEVTSKCLELKDGYKFSDKDPWQWIPVSRIVELS